LQSVADTPPALSVIIGAGPLDDVLACLRSAIDFTTSFGNVEFFAIDREEDAGTTAALRSLTSSALNVVSAPNADWRLAWNTALQHVRGEFALLISCDVRLIPNCVETLALILREHPERFAVSPALFSGPTSMPSNPSEVGHGVCFLVRRDQLWQGASDLAYVSFAYATVGSFAGER
jgi:glycosyltransferase involved in cell wall biosynthesis